MNTNKEVRHTVSKFLSAFSLSGFQGLNEKTILKAVDKLRYGDGKFYVKEINGIIYAIEFESIEACYTSEEFSKKHAVEIYKALERELNKKHQKSISTESKIEQIESLLCCALKSAIKAQLKETDYAFGMGYGSENRESSENVREIFFKYGLKVRLIDSPRRNTIIAQYELLDKFGKIFTKKGLAPYFDAYFFEYDDNESIVISKESQLEFLRECGLTYLVGDSITDSTILDELYLELRKAYLLLLIEN